MDGSSGNNKAKQHKIQLSRSPKSEEKKKDNGWLWGEPPPHCSFLHTWGQKAGNQSTIFCDQLKPVVWSRGMEGMHSAYNGQMEKGKEMQRYNKNHPSNTLIY